MMTSSSSPSSSSHDHQGSASYPAHHEAYDSEDDDEEICVDDEDRSTYSSYEHTPHIDVPQAEDSMTQREDSLVPSDHFTASEQGQKSDESTAEPPKSETPSRPSSAQEADSEHKPQESLEDPGNKISTEERVVPTAALSPAHSTSSEPRQRTKRDLEDAEDEGPSFKRLRADEHEKEASSLSIGEHSHSEPRSPPNVTVVQPSVHHPMLSYLYQTGMYPSVPPTLPPHLTHMMPNGTATGSPGTFPWPFMPHPSFGGPDLTQLSPTSASALAAQAASSGLLASSLSMGGHPALSGHPWLHPSYAAAAVLGHPSFSEPSDPSSSPPRSRPGLPPNHSPGGGGSLFTPPKSCTTNSSQGLSFKPYALPDKRPAPAPPAAGSPLREDLEHRSPTGSVTPPRHSPPALPQPIRAHHRSEPSQLSNMEKMVIGLEPKQEPISFVNMSKMGQCR